MRLQVKSVQLHDFMFIKDVGNIKTSLPGDHKGMELLGLEDSMVHVSYNGVYFLIPVVNCKNIVLNGNPPNETKGKKQ